MESGIDEIVAPVNTEKRALIIWRPLVDGSVGNISCGNYAQKGSIPEICDELNVDQYGQILFRGERTACHSELPCRTLCITLDLINILISPISPSHSIDTLHSDENTLSISIPHVRDRTQEIRDTRRSRRYRQRHSDKIERSAIEYKPTPKPKRVISAPPNLISRRKKQQLFHLNSGR